MYLQYWVDTYLTTDEDDLPPIAKLHNDGRVRRHRYHHVERVGLERLGTGRGGSVRRAGDRGVQCLRSGGVAVTETDEESNVG